MDRTHDFNFVSFGKRVFITLTDLLVNASIIFCSFYILQYSIEYNTAWPQFIYFFGWLGLYTYLLVSFGISPGTFLVRAKVVNSTGNYVNISAALFRNLPYLLSLILHTALIWNTTSQMSASPIVPNSFYQIIDIYNTHSPFLFQILIGFQLFILFDTLSTLFNAQRRALRDFLSDSYVIDRTNYYRIFLHRKHQGDGIYQKTETELQLEKEREFEFKILNHVMEIPEVMQEIQRVNEFRASKIIAKIVAKPVQGQSSFYEISIKENDIPLFYFRVHPKSMRIYAKDGDAFVPLAAWRKKHYNVNWIRTYFFLH
ncbi:MAG: RDD family protein [Flammeovirgaceae bacterium]